MKYLLIAFFAMAIIRCADAQTRVIKGHIYDLQGNQPLMGATVASANSQTITKTNTDGYFELPLGPSEEDVHISMLGYKKQIVSCAQHKINLHIQLEPDPVSLNEVRISAYGIHKTTKETAGSIAILHTAQIQQGNGTSLQSALNSVPGVNMDQSTLSESRISIRGNGTRAQWGIRNIKIYMNDIPVTEADGTSRIEALDVNDIGQVEIIKGPASSIYGAGTGGVINFRMQRSPYAEQSMELSSLVGSYGLTRLAATYRNGGDKINSYLSYGWQQFDGYRAHNNDMRRFIAGNFQFFPSKNRTVTLLVNRTTQHTQIPGALSREQMEADPRQASASNVEKQAGRYQNWTRIGAGQQYQFNDQLTNSSSIFTYFYDLDHPLAYAYIRNYYQSYGGRTRFTYNPHFSVLPTVFTVGGEFNQANTKGSQYVNEKGKEGALNGNTDYKNTLYSIFYQSETNITARTTLALGVSLNGLTYDVHDYLLPERSGVKKFRTQASPRVALSHHFSEWLSLHASVSSGFSPPTGSEIKNVDGSINPTLQAEKGINYELNAKGNILKSRLSYDLALFKMDVKGELIAQSVQQGITVYNNAGRTSHNGAELSLSYVALQESDGNWVSLLRPYAALTYSHFRYDDYKTRDSDGQVSAIYDGNNLVGISPWVVNTGVNVETREGIFLNGSYFFRDRLPLDDANTAYNASYQVVNAKVGYKKTIAEHLGLSIYAGLDNITNERYSSLTALNAVAYGGGSPAYFQPALPRNGYGGLQIKYIF
ncbi:TonB-dependent receptor domain-containing protein [Sphingobacterium suaedae]|uniref:TonB-dependent receptor domain-containing protein n=1 Tax=Sphingobacterium suaedae TaxID=1686402 RepID=A0ABW5KKD7_9SPHI